MIKIYTMSMGVHRDNDEKEIFNCVLYINGSSQEIKKLSKITLHQWR